MIPPNLERAVYGVYATQALHLADRHGVFGALARGPAGSAELAGSLGLDPDTLDRLLLVLRSIDLVGTDADGRYVLDEATRAHLDPRSPRYLGDFVSHLVGSTAAQLPRLDEYLAKGKETVDAGRPQPFEVLYADDDSISTFVSAMWNLSYDVSTELVPPAGLGAASHLVDVGGAGGPFSVAALRALPELTATVFDLPAVEPHLLRSREEHGLGDRLHFVGGDFFADPLPGGDAIAFGYILSDWTDETCALLLAKAYAACAPGGRVLVMERLFDDDHAGPPGTAFMNLSMHLETQGRHRTAGEYIALLTAAGFTGCEVHRSTRDKHLVVGRKPLVGP
jgi:hypothetical protein